MPLHRGDGVALVLVHLVDVNRTRLAVVGVPALLAHHFRRLVLAPMALNPRNRDGFPFVVAAAPLAVAHEVAPSAVAIIALQTVPVQPRGGLSRVAQCNIPPDLPHAATYLIAKLLLHSTHM